MRIRLGTLLLLPVALAACDDEEARADDATLDGPPVLADVAVDAAADVQADAEADTAADAIADAGPDAAPPDREGHPEPLGAGPGEAHAGRAAEGDLPPWPSGLQTWATGDFILANDRVAIVIEDAGTSDLYDPYGGKPVGVARVEDGAMVEPMDFGELLILTGRMTVMAEQVSVVNDGMDGGAAIVRATGPIRPVPFFTSITSIVFAQDYSVFDAVIEYVLEPDADHVDVYYLYENADDVATRIPVTMHGFMYTPRVPAWAPNAGFRTNDDTLPLLAFVDEDATSLAYLPRDGQQLRPGINTSGFKSNFTGGFVVQADAETRVHHARLVIAGPGLDGIVRAVARLQGDPVRALTGVVRDASGEPAPGVRVHAVGPEGQHLTRTLSGADGAYRLHLPEAVAVELTGWRRGDLVVESVAVAAGDGERDLVLAPGGWVNVTATERGAGAIPVRVQLLPVEGFELPSVPDHFGESGVTGGRLHVDYPADGRSRLRAPAGEWEVVVSRGFEYSLHRERVTVVEGAELAVTAELERVVSTPGIMCADFHIHSHRSNDSGDDANLKLRSAAADGLEIPARSEHEFVEPWDDRVVALGLGPFMYGMSSVELTTFEQYGHFGVIPVEPGPGPNGGTPLWQRYPTLDAPDVAVEQLLAPELFANVRARPERPRIIINHPRGGGNYFDAVGYDPATGEVANPEMWDEEFRLVEFFKGAGDWRSNLSGPVADWLGFLNHGRRVFAVGSSDSHGIYQSPVGYPRTCMSLGTDDPRAVTGSMVRDALALGHATVSGGIYLDVNVGEAGPGDDATGLGPTTTLHLRVQAASWIDVDAFDVVVDGVLVTTTPITAEHVNPDNPTIRFEADLEIDVAEGGSFVIVAAYGDAAMEPMLRGKRPFGVTNPIFLGR